jgi:alpha-L-rhamnosidase
MNGQQVGAGGAANGPQYFTITGLQGTNEVFAVSFTNTFGGPSAAIGAFLVAYDDGSSVIVDTDSSWKGLPGAVPPSNFQASNFDDSQWPNAIVAAAFGTGPWAGWFTNIHQA